MGDTPRKNSLIVQRRTLLKFEDSPIVAEIDINNPPKPHYEEGDTDPLPLKVKE